MKNSLLQAFLLLNMLTTLPSSIGCSGGEKSPPTPEQLEEIRQDYIQRAKQFQHEGVVPK